MKVILIGSGGREHAIAWKLKNSPLLEKLYIAPGNAGMSGLGTLVPLKVDDTAGLARFASEKKIDLAVIGPEAALAAGVSDALRAAGISVFGPSQAAARIETSKSFSKEFMLRHNIPTARFSVFQDYQKACDHLKTCASPMVIKASGLAAGKGVLLPETNDEGLTALKEIMLDAEFGDAGREVIIEERLSGEEVSLLAFCDGRNLSPMPPSQDHKRLLDQDKGPQYRWHGRLRAAPCLSKEIENVAIKTILQPAVDGLAEEGMPYVGVLYAGLMLTEDGPKALEFNARFGDPETQAILPLLETDLLEIFAACCAGNLHTLPVRWSDKTAVCVVLASAGYPADP
jgi:phosphoribosylamine--glycine ligase